MSDPLPPSLDEQRWRLVLSREATHDGQLAYDVQAIGIYCCPSCSSQRVKRSNVEFFETDVVVRAAGFRPYYRCLPGQVNARKQAVAWVRHLLEKWATPRRVTCYHPHTSARSSRQSGLNRPGYRPCFYGLPPGVQQVRQLSLVGQVQFNRQEDAP